jgi:hypothetical protein
VVAIGSRRRFATTTRGHRRGPLDDRARRPIATVRRERAGDDVEKRADAYIPMDHAICARLSIQGRAVWLEARNADRDHAVASAAALGTASARGKLARPDSLSSQGARARRGEVSFGVRQFVGRWQSGRWPSDPETARWRGTWGRLVRAIRASQPATSDVACALRYCCLSVSIPLDASSCLNT